MATALAVALRAGALSSVSPMGASVGVTINITGTGFNTTAASNDVVFTPATGAPVTASGSSLTTLDNTTGLRRLSVIVPPGLPVGTTAVRVVNRPTGEASEGRSFEVIALTLPGATSGAPGTTNLAVRVTGSPNTQFVSGTRVTFGAGITVTSTTIESPTSLVATISIAANAAIGPRDVNTTNSPQSAKLVGGFSVQAAQTNHPPLANPGTAYAGTAGQLVSFAGTASDPDGDPLTLIWNFGDGTPTASGLAATHTYAQPGNYTVTFSANDGRGGVTSATAAVTIAPAATLLSLDIDPGTLRFSQRGATTALAVTGHYSDGTSRSLTSAAGTTYLVDAPQVATVSDGGVVTAVGNGNASITVANSGLTQIVRAVVEEGVLLQSLELTPPVSTLREVGATAQATLWGQFSDGSRRNLTNDAATIFRIDPATVASISATGVITALAEGTGTLTARNGGLATTAQVRVLVTTGAGFLRGEVFDDSRGLPLSGATATLLVDSGAGQQVPADDRGRFVLPAGAGAALVRVERNGFTTVERTAVLPRNEVATLLDTRLTPLDGRLNLLQSVFGGQAASTDGTATLSVPSGSLESDVALRVTPLSNQGLQALLPAGWSPIAAVDLQPAGRRFAQPATLRLPHIDTLAAGSPVTLVTYDVAAHRWVVQTPGRVSDDRRTLSASIDVTGQYAFVVPDDAPLAPPAAISGEALAGLTTPVVPDTATATGQVVPRSAPPGDNARAVGTVVLQPASPLSSGAVLRARVSEQFDLLDTSRVRPLPFVQDIVLYARPRLGAPGSLATRLPITPTLQFSIQQLSLGQVHLDVTVDEPSTNSAIIGTGGGSLSDAAGDVLDLQAGALTDDIAVGLLPLTADQLSIPVPDGFTLLGAAFVDLVGGSFAQPALLSIARPNSLDAFAQVVVAHVITDGTGGRRFKIVGVGQVAGTRLSVQTALGTLNFEGVRSGGEYAFLRPSQPLGFVAGLVNAVGSSPQSLALVTADTAPFAFVTDSTGTFIVAGRVGVQTTVAAIEAAGATASAGASLTTPNNVATLTLTLAQTSPAVTATTPGANATSVALDASIIVDFSKPIDPATVTSSSVVLGIGQAAVATQPVLSANRRRLTITPASPLTGLTTYTLTLTSGIRDSVGVPLAAFAPRTFTTLDPSKPAALALGVITAELPDEDGLSLITGAPGAAEPASAVVATNLRTQETTAVLALADGSFRLRLTVVAGDTIAMTLRDKNGRESTFSITQFSSSDGTTSIGQEGGTVSGAGGRLGRVVPRALASAGLFHLTDPGTAPLPTLPASFGVADRFTLTIDGATFRRLDSLTLTESQGRFAPGTALAAPFAATGQLTIPSDFLVSASLRYTASAVDRDGTRHSANGATVVVASSPDTSSVETGFSDQFPTVFVSAPKQAIPTQVLNVSAVAPTARVEFDLPTSFTPQPGDTLVLARLTELSGETKLSVVDRLTRVDVAGAARLRTSGRELPGATRAGEYLVVSGPLALVSGRANGPAAVVSADGSPFVFETDGANGSFVIPVPAGSPFTLHFVNAATGAPLGDATGQAPQGGNALNIGQPLAPASGALTVSAQPDAQSVVDIGTPLVFTFSEPLDRASVTAAAFVVTDGAGARAFGSVALSGNGRIVTFVPSRRWRYATRYRYGVATSLAGASGARLISTFGGEFTTFAPRVLGTVPLSDVRDVAANGNLGLAATAEGISVLDLTRADAPAVVSSVAIAGGSRGAALVMSPLADRTGQPTATPLGVVSAGDITNAGLVQTYSLADPVAPALLGSTQVTTPSGQTAPPGVPNAPGVPNSVIVDTSGRALVSVRDVGVTAVSLGAAIPIASSAPETGIGARYPALAFERISQAALLGERVAVVGAAGLTLLDSSLRRLGSIATSGDPHGIATVAAFEIDLNADGAIDGASERFDLTAVANGAEGSVQLYRISDPASPELLSVIRIPGGAESAVVNVEDKVLYVGAGSRGLAFVDLSAGPSIQPIDADRDGIDDRILGFVDTPGTAGRVALDLARGVAHIADTTGVVSLQVVPPRVRFTSIVRDPVSGHAGDEETIGEEGLAYLTDDMLQLRINAAIDGVQAATLTIEESSSGARALTFANGATAVPLHAGSSQTSVRIARGSTGADVAFVVRDTLGLVLARRTLKLVTPPPNPEFLSMFAAPQSVSLDDSSPVAPLAVGGELTDGRVLNITQASQGTLYAPLDSAVASVNADGVVSAGGGGRTTIEVSNGSLREPVFVRVSRPAALVGLEAGSTLSTLLTTEPTALGFAGIFSDGSRQPASSVRGTSFVTSNSAVVAVDAEGRVTAVADGVATIRAINGSFEASAEVAVELRGPSSLALIDLTPFTTPISADTGQVVASVTVAGTGALHGHVVTFTGSGGQRARAVTDAEGHAAATLTQMTVAGSVALTATVVDPTTGETRSDTESVTVIAGTSDSEPNGNAASASPLSVGRRATGSLTAGTDAQDTFRVESSTGGMAKVDLSLLAGTGTGDVVLVIRDANGVELSRMSPPSSATSVTVAVPPGVFFVSVELMGQAARYSLSAKITQGPVTIQSVSPSSAPAGTAVVISGSGFSTRGFENAVFFGPGGVRGKLLSSSPTRLEVIVPANAVDGNLQIVSGGRGVAGPNFVVGNAGTRPVSFAMPGDPAKLRYDPISGAVVDVSRIWVYFDAPVDRVRVDQVVAGAGGSIVGFMPSQNRYLVERSTGNTLADVRGLRAALRSLPDVTGVSLVDAPEADNHEIDADSGRAMVWDNGVSSAAPYELVNLFDAIKAIRNTEQFRSAANLRPVKIAIIDTGFDPGVMSEFPGTVEFQAKDAHGVWSSPGRIDFAKGHGTGVAGIVAGANNGTEMSGTIGSLFWDDEIADRASRVELTVYSCGIGGKRLDAGCLTDALEEIGDRNDFDIVNMSFGGKNYELAVPSPGCPDAGVLSSGGERRCDYFLPLQRTMQRTLFIASAGNDGVVSNNTFPSAVAADLDNVLSIGAVATPGDEDGTHDQPDHRALFDSSPRTDDVNPADQDCRGFNLGQQPQSASNCGRTVSLAAPGEDFWTTGRHGNEYRSFNGTSAAAPLVTGVAAILQSIRPSATRFTPVELADLLIDTADDISSNWSTITGEPMWRLNALAAVRAVLPAASQQYIFVTDQADSTPTGSVVALNVNPVDGTLSGLAKVIPLTFTEDGATLTGTRPTAIVAGTPGGFEALVLAQTNHPSGDAIFVINTHSLTVAAVIFLNGDPFPATGSGGGRPPIKATVQSTMVLSPNGRVLYVAAGTHLAVIDIVGERAISNLNQMWMAPGYARPIPFAPVNDGPISSVIAANGTEITGLDISPNGRSLYATVQSGVGSGYQRGFLLEIDVALDRDSDPSTPLVELDASSFLQLKNTTSTFKGNDEPSGVAASPDGKHVYMTNGGVDRFLAVSLTAFDAFVASLREFAANMFSTPYIDMSVNDLTHRGQYTQLLAPGVTQAFNIVNGSLDAQAFRFPSELAAAWTPDNPAISDQFFRKQVNAERPFGMAFRYDGRRAIVPFFQTGNFGVLDLVGQTFQPTLSPPDVFQGPVAVTPSLNLDASLWPENKAQEALLYPSHVVYAQNGRFAVGVHTGVHGGAVTILDDDKISTDLARNLNETVPDPDDPSDIVPSYAVQPLCDTRASYDSTDCLTNVFTTLTEYNSSSGTHTFARPRGVAILPFVSHLGKQFGDRLGIAQGMVFSWRDGSASSVRAEAWDLGPAETIDPAPTSVGAPIQRALTDEERTKQKLSLMLDDFFPPFTFPADNTRFRIKVEILDGSGNEIGHEEFEVIFRL